MRPQAIVYFERIIFATLALGVWKTWQDWDALIAKAAISSANPTGFTVFVLCFTFAWIATLTLLVSRRRSKIAMWISLAFFVLGLPAMFLVAANGLLVGSSLITALQTVGQLVAYGLLFTPTARRWINRETGAPVIS
jgi:hypothetical protein